MKKLLSILIICLLLIAACVTTNQNLESLSSSYDGIWEGYTDIPEGRFSINMEIKNGIMSGFFEDKKIKGYIKADDSLFISPFSTMGAHVVLETNSMSPDRMEGTLIAVSYRHQWFVVRNGKKRDVY
jgi:hypothetical protein